MIHRHQSTGNRDISHRLSRSQGSVASSVSGSNTNSSSSRADVVPESIPKSQSNWKILDLLKLQNSSKPSRSTSIKAKGRPSTAATLSKGNYSPPPPPLKSPKTSPREKSVNRCICCGTILTFIPNSYKFKCGVCHTTNEFGPLNIGPDNFNPDIHPHLISYKYVRKLVDKCVSVKESEVRSLNPKSLHEIFEPLSNYLLQSFSNLVVLNNSFKLRRASRRAHYSTSNIDYYDIRHTFNMLTRLPTKRPLYNALYGSNESLKKLNTSLIDDPRNIAWVLILLEIPFLSRALTHTSNEKEIRSMVDVPEIKSLCYEILKRCFGILAQTSNTTTNNYLASWMSKLTNEEFISKVELINLYITFHLKKYFYIANNPLLMRRRSSHTRNASNGAGSSSEYMESSNLKEDLEAELSNFNTPLNQITHSFNGFGSSIGGANSKETKIKIHLYGNDWHFKTAGLVLSIFFKSNLIRYKANKLPINIFYNSLVDFVNIKLDFDSWQTNQNAIKNSNANNNQPELQTVIDYINGKQNPVNEGASYFFCQYPFLISLGGKISVLEYEARRQMERKAEEAFINSLDKRVAMDVYFKVQVRRNYIVQDSLRAIQMNNSNLKKSLRVKFLGEPGIDAGGLKKEWFLLLTKELFSFEAGMLINVEDSNYYWFNISKNDNYDLYYLFGSILGLAIYNSTILELKFSMILYKLLLGLPIGLSDYQELYPISCDNLFKLRDYDDDTLDLLDLTFEVSFNDSRGKVITKELIPGGSKVKVSSDNREYYIDKYSRFFMVDGFGNKIDSFINGFNNVIGGNALSLFSAEEIQLLLCGSEESKLDIDILKSITKYNGWLSREVAIESSIIKWFWDFLEELPYQKQKKFLLFVTGSDRLPATGIQNLNFKITLLNNGKKSHRLPVAHTCFNELALYNYETQDIMVQKISQAVEGSSGFGIK